MSHCVPLCTITACFLPRRYPLLSTHPPPSYNPLPYSIFPYCHLSLPQPDLRLREFVRACYGHRFPLQPYPSCCFPFNVLDPGAFPSVPYHLAFWGVPCVNFSGLRRRDIPGDFLSGVVGSLVIFREALSDLRLNPPSIFIVENTASLLGLPWVLECINQALDALPYHWRYPSLALAFFLPPFPP